ncbi:MAG: Maf family protein [Anaerovoracaceae bacterium]|jgi:septum formation protein
MQSYRIILASGSPRRREILERAGLNPLILPAGVDETLPEGIRPDDAVMYLSLKKALFTEKRILGEEPGEAAPGSLRDLIITADTVVTKNGLIMGKPVDRDDAYQMIDRIRGTNHQVMTGVTLLLPGAAARRTFVDVTEVWLKDIPEEELLQYIETDEPYDKAGGYAIQLTFSRYVDHIEGSCDNVVGLPFDRMVQELEKLENLENGGIRS